MDLKMEVYSTSLELLGVLEEFRSVIWEDKAFTAGSFSVEAPLTDNTRWLLAEENILLLAGDTAGIIEHREESAEETGTSITVKGRLLAGILDRRVLWGQYSVTGKPAAIMRQLVDDCAVNPTRGDSVSARVIPNLVIDESDDDGGSDIRLQKTGGSLLGVLETIGAAYHVAFGVRLNPAVPRMEFWTRDGVDRTIEQSANEPVFYSTELDDVLSADYSYDSSEYRNFALVAGCGEGSSRIYAAICDGAVVSFVDPTGGKPSSGNYATVSYVDGQISEAVEGSY